MKKYNKKATLKKQPARKIMNGGKQVKTVNDVSKSETKTMSNGLEGIILGYQQERGVVQLSQVETLQKNTRYYLVSNYRQLLSQIYVEHGVIQTVIDIPVDDGMRGGVEIKSAQLSPDELEELQMAVEYEDDIGIFGQGLKWQRLFGGGAIMIITDQDPEEELDWDELEGSKLEFRAVDMWELYYTRQNTEDYSAAIDDDDDEFLDYYDYYGQKVHQSRVIKLKGIEAPSFVRPRLRGWGVSEVEKMIRSINQYLKSTDLTFEVLDEFKLDIFKIADYADTLLMEGGEALVQKRVALANYQKNYQNSLTMDAEDDYIQKQLSFSGLAEVGAGIRMQLASDLRIPLTKLFGISAAGFNSGEDDIENYNSMVESQIRQKAKFGILKMLKIRCMVKFGYIPDDLKIEFKPLRILPADQEENVKNSKFSRLLQARQAGEITSEVFRDACNKGNLLDVQLDATSADQVILDGKEDEAEVTPSKGGKTKLNAPSAPSVKNWDESKHPRQEDGKFGEGGGSGGSDGKSPVSRIEDRLKKDLDIIKKMKDVGEREYDQVKSLMEKSNPRSVEYAEAEEWEKEYRKKKVKSLKGLMKRR